MTSQSIHIYINVEIGAKRVFLEANFRIIKNAFKVVLTQHSFLAEFLRIALGVSKSQTFFVRNRNSKGTITVTSAL